MSSNPSFFNASQSPSGADSSPEELYSYPENYTPLVHANSHLENRGIFDQGINFKGLELTYLMESQLD